MDIQIDHHALQRARERGATEDEIKDVILNGFSVQAKYGRFAKAKIFPFRQKRLHRYYEEKKIEVIYAVKKKSIITVTVYVFYGKW